MNAKFALDQLESIIIGFKNKENDERLKYFGTLNFITDKLLKLSENLSFKKNVVGENIVKLLWSIEALCGLDDGNGKSDSEHISLALGTIYTLKVHIDWDN
ncbi:hypothetical protein [Pseudobacteroides cellulosolvens]|uniref:Uncharacterized protein n=1 Tax=Pseudobacteroides cellulosolvens ATCC 35603 = DSM 2933 TaxID=398512 RepID=A0A0L6JXJ1_9FIRM|nr:hypothetical protein [Pseudobacteroides cellulosolvens]KNY30162.1 hypothetical protein Bccel_5439 [Pseudobacteroides cellulosolvens ATCC 35603 = DSM 2933]